MKRRQIAVVFLCLLVAFGLGLWLGGRVSGNRRAPRHAVLTASEPSGTAPPTPATSNDSPCADIRNASPLVGKRGCVAGVVLRTFTSRAGNTFLDFCQDYRACPFSSVIFASDRDKFGDLASLQGKRVEIRGDVVSYQDHAEIVIHDPQQLRNAP